MLIALDTETNGIDLYHGAAPFFVTICLDSNPSKPMNWVWDVDPRTRQVHYDMEDLKEIRDIIQSADEVVLQNPKFDVKALDVAYRTVGLPFEWDWGKTHDTLIAGHILATNMPHNLTDMALQYLGIDIQPYEKLLQSCVEQCRRWARSHQPTWRIAKAGLPEMPSAKGECWRMDYWLPKAVARERNEPLEHEFHRVLKEYASLDSGVTLNLWYEMRKLLEKRGLFKIYQQRMRLLPVIHRIEVGGVTAHQPSLEKMRCQYTDLSEEHRQSCENIARSMGFDLTLPKAGNNKSLAEFISHVNGLNIQRPGSSEGNGKGIILRREHLTEGGKVSISKSVMEYAETFLQDVEPRGKRLAFLQSFRKKRKLDTSLTYLSGYERFWRPLVVDRRVEVDELQRSKGKKGLRWVKVEDAEWRVLYPSINPTGSQTLRMSSQNPNAQNVCFDPQTEFLTTRGWVYGSDLTEAHEVAQFWPENGSIDFTYPLEVQRHHYKGEMQWIRTEQQIDLMVTSEHRCLLRNRKTKSFLTVFARDYRSDYQHLHAGRFVGGDTNLSADVVTWICAVQADGSYVRVDGKLYGIKFIFVKKRKIERLRACLQRLGVRFTEKIDGDRVGFYIGKYERAVELVKRLMPDKSFGSWLLECDRQTLDLFAEELFFWDGDFAQRRGFTSRKKVNADWVQIVWTLSGSRAWIASRMAGTTRIALHHYVNVAEGRDSSMTTNHTREEIPWDGTVYCVTVPSSYVVVRRNGKVSISGNSKGDLEGGSLRNIFGPAPGREWWDLDAKNIEARIPAYVSGEQDLINLYERPDEPPYYGSGHLLNFHTVFPEIWAKVEAEVGFEQVGPTCKKKYIASNYQWTKNGGFAIQYGAGEATTDRAFHKRGAYRLLKERFSRLEALNQQCIAHAEKYGYVETIPDKSVDPRHGYPILCSRGENGKVLSTVPLNYWSQGSACWWACQALIRCQAQLDEWRKADGFDGRIVLYVHDSIVFDFPKSVVHPRDVKDLKYSSLNLEQQLGSNLWRIKVLQGLMESCGNDIGVPTPVGIEYCAENWGKGETFG